jgi:quinol monooxygenase YgiN
MALYARQGKLIAKQGQRDALAAILLADETGLASMPGCRVYLVMAGEQEPDVVYVTEVWDSKEAHRASLALPGVKAAIARATPLMAGGDGTELTYLGGLGPD